MLEIKQINNINIQSFEVLFKKHYSSLCSFALKYTGNSSEAEEVVQAVFCKVWEKRSTINIKTSVKSYLYISVKNKCLQNIEHKKTTRRYRQYVKKQHKTEKANPHEVLIYEESIDIFNEAIDSLPDKCRQIFMLSRFEGLKYKEIAKELSVSIKTVEANISKALKIFRVYFPEYLLNKK